MYSCIVSIRLKIVLVVLPVLIVAVVLAGMSSQIVATRAVTRIATEFLDFKASELEKYAESQWNLLVQNDVADRPEMVAAAQAGVESFALTIVRSDSEAIIAIGPTAPWLCGHHRSTRHPKRPHACRRSIRPAPGAFSR